MKYDFLVELPVLQTMKQVTERVRRPAHRIIHLCETEVVCPTVPAAGRGTVRRFTREEVFRVALALDLQDIGAEARLLQKLMVHLNKLMAMKEIKTMRYNRLDFDLVTFVQKVGSMEKPVLAWLTPPDQIALVIPKFILPSTRKTRVDIHADVGELVRRGASFVVNLSTVAAGW